MKLLKGLYGWSLKSAAALDAAMRSTDVPPLTFHCAYYPQFGGAEARDEDEHKDEPQVKDPFQAKSRPDFMMALHAKFEEIASSPVTRSLVDTTQSIRRATATEYQRQLREYVLRETRVRRRPDIESLAGTW